MLKNVKLCGYEVCTPIQAYCIPAIIQGHDVFASAQTGTHPQKSSPRRSGRS